MLPLPNLPTDNLYKFMALSGVALYIFAVSVMVVINNRWNDINDRYAFSQELDSLENRNGIQTKRAEIAKHAADTRMLLQRFQNESSDALRRQAARRRAMSGTERRGDSTVSAAIDTIRNVLVLDSLRMLLVRDLLHDDSAIATDRMLMRQSRRDNDLLRTASYMVFVAALMAFWGFVLWYSRVQKYQDVLLKRQALGDEREDERESGEAHATDADDAEDEEDVAAV